MVSSVPGRTLFLLLLQLTIAIHLVTLVNATAGFKCIEDPGPTTSGNELVERSSRTVSGGGSGCMNGGVCKNGTCICKDGWQGSECQFCGGKVR